MTYSFLTQLFICLILAATKTRSTKQKGTKNRLQKSARHMLKSLTRKSQPSTFCLSSFPIFRSDEDEQKQKSDGEEETGEKNEEANKLIDDIFGEESGDEQGEVMIMLISTYLSIHFRVRPRSRTLRTTMNSRLNPSAKRIIRMTRKTSRFLLSKPFIFVEF